MTCELFSGYFALKYYAMAILLNYVISKLVVRVLLYGCEKWKMNKGAGKAINVLQNKFRHIKWQDHVGTVGKSEHETAE